MPGSPFIVLVVSVAAGLYAWLSGRTLLARVGDPLFPELHLARTQRLVAVWVLASPLVILTDGPHELWGMPLLALAVLIGGYPYRRTLFGETWGLAEYVRYSVASLIGSIGFWVLVALMPLLIVGLAERAMPESPASTALAIGVVFALGLLIWEPAFPRVWVALHRGTPLDRADLRPRFDAIIQRAQVPAPPTFRYGAPGGYIMNAVALPSTRRSCVALGDSLLDALEPDEIAAIFAHEIAHLEHYRGPLLVRARIATWIIVVVAAAIPPVLIAGAPSVSRWLGAVWAFAIFGALAVRAARNRAHESDCDRRAAALVGDPEPVIRALTKLHHFARMPRRWPYDFERAASHPSLANRIQALRRDGTAPPVSLAAPVTLRSTTSGVFVALDAARLYRFEGGSIPAVDLPPGATPQIDVPTAPAPQPAPSLATLRESARSYHAVAYSDLAELRVAASPGGAQLRVRDRTGKRWAVPVHPDDVEAAQRALDLLDGRLSPATAATPWRTKARLAAVAVALFGAAFLGWIWVPVVITLIAPSVGSLAAVAAMGLARMVFAFVGPSTLPAWPLAVLWLPAIVWACVVTGGWSRSGDDRGSARPVAIGLGTIAIVLIGALVSAGVPTVRALRGEPALISLVVTMLGAGALLLSFRDRSRRAAGIGMTALAIVVGLGALLGTQRLGVAPDRFAWTDAGGDALGGFTVTGYTRRLELSPDGRRALVQEYPHGDPDAEYGDGDPGPSWFTIGTPAGIEATIDAFDLAFLDDGRLLILGEPASNDSARRDSLELVVRQPGASSAAVWRRSLPYLLTPTLTVDRATGGWTVVGYDTRRSDGYRPMMYSGAIGSDRLAASALPRELAALQPLRREPDETLVAASVRTSYSVPATIFRALGMTPLEWDFWRLDGGDRQFVGALPGYPDCSGDGVSMLCVVTGRDGFTLWRIDPAGILSPVLLGNLPIGEELWRAAGSDALVGISAGGDSLAIRDFATGRGLRITLGAGRVDSSSRVIDLATGPSVAAVVVRGARRSTVTFYAIPWPARRVSAGPAAPDR